LLADDPDEAYEELEEHDPSVARFPAAPDSPHARNRELDPGSLKKPPDA
jgi:hypothetical protein